MRNLAVQLFVCGFFFVAIGLVSQASAQQRTGQGAFGQRTVGSAGGTAAPRSNSSSQTSANNVTLMQDVTGGISGNERFIRGNRGGEFVGAGMEDARAVGVSQAMEGGRAQQFSMIMSGRNNPLGQLMQNSFNQQFGRQGQGQSRTQIRVPIRLGFNPQPVVTSRFTAQFQTRLGKLPALTTVGPIEVGLDGDAVVLRGTVASEGDRQLAERLALLEPEVMKVRNELKVQQADTAGGALPVPTSATPSSER